MALSKRLPVKHGLVFSFLLCLAGAHGWAQESDQQQMRGLDEQVQEIKSDVLSISEELSRLEEKLLYPSGTQVAVFVSLVEGDPMRLDAVRLQIDGQLVAHHIYSSKELTALRKGGVQRLYVGNVTTGEPPARGARRRQARGRRGLQRDEELHLPQGSEAEAGGRLTLAGPNSEKRSDHARRVVDR